MRLLPGTSKSRREDFERGALGNELFSGERKLRKEGERKLRKEKDSREIDRRRAANKANRADLRALEDR